MSAWCTVSGERHGLRGADSTQHGERAYGVGSMRRSHRAALSLFGAARGANSEGSISGSGSGASPYAVKV
ncbi:hypothetical protein Ae505Ps2_6312c [Pseudonocardia sp. Ae505_Ps2]|nr:hypothetical protein Ae505Ps2_6308c [Pseudonocardia sp. Ae505_Ps2]OLM08252.1 hypothetical protein Ae505Ps2_6312c [Pseudonocardia sp. Ae505_Ps2]